MSAKLLYRMLGKRQVKHRDAAQAEGGMVKLRQSADIKIDAFGREGPLRMRQLAGSNRTMVNHEAIRSDFINHFSGKCKWIRTGEDRAARSQLQSCGSVHVVELAGGIWNVVFGPRRFHVDVVLSTLQFHMARGRGFSRI